MSKRKILWFTLHPAPAPPSEVCILSGKSLNISAPMAILTLVWFFDKFRPGGLLVVVQDEMCMCYVHDVMMYIILAVRFTCISSWSSVSHVYHLGRPFHLYIILVVVETSFTTNYVVSCIVGERTKNSCDTLSSPSQSRARARRFGGLAGARGGPQHSSQTDFLRLSRRESSHGSLGFSSACAD